MVEVHLVDIYFTSQIIKIGDANEIAGAGEPAWHGNLSDFLQLCEDDTVGRRC
jgi:hypothetical protein